jgi:two-component system sensor histidine kinase RstB
MAERIERLVRGRDELVQAVSHELGSPLSRLRFHVELLESELTEQHRQRLAAMSSELDELDELAAELLGYVQSDDLKLDQREFLPHKILGDLVELAKLEVSDDRTVQVDSKLAEGVVVAADPRLLQRAVENLLRNATRHARGHVLLEAILGEGALRVAVHDDGPGIPEHLRDKVLAPFYRTQSDRGRRTGGVGLGLAIVNRIVQRHGGQVLIGDSPLGGAVVTTVWPRARRESTESTDGKGT